VVVINLQRRLRLLLGLVKIIEPVQLFDLSNLVFIAEHEGVTQLGYDDWYPVNNVGVISPVLEIDVARLIYHGLIHANNDILLTTNTGKRFAETVKLPQEIIALGPKGWRTLALDYVKTSILKLKSYTPSQC